jgi:hypothetical protein
MKTGVIIYIAGDPPIAQTFDPEAIVSQVKTLNLDADRVEVTSTHLGHFDIHDAWWSLICKGMQRILCAKAEFNADGKIQLKGEMLRLCG